MWKKSNFSFIHKAIVFLCVLEIIRKMLYISQLIIRYSLFFFLENNSLYLDNNVDKSYYGITDKLLCFENIYESSNVVI